MSASGPSGPLVGLFESGGFTQVLLYSQTFLNTLFTRFLPSGQIQ